MVDNIFRLHRGEPKAAALECAILNLIDERGEGLSLASIVGVLEVVKANLIYTECVEAADE